MHETPPEILERSQVIKKLRELLEKGVSAPENLDFLATFFERKEAEIKTHRDLILFNVYRGEIYQEAGYIQQAEINFLSAYEQARDEGDVGLAADIAAKLGALPPY